MGKLNLRRRQIGGQRKFHAWKKWKSGNNVQAEFEGEAHKADKFGKKGWNCKILYSNFADLKEGDSVTLNHVGILADKMATLEVGDVFELDYRGINTIEKGEWAGSDSHLIDIFVLEDGDDETSDAEVGYDV